MGQSDVCEWFKSLKGDSEDEYFSIAQICKKMKNAGKEVSMFSVWRSVIKLYHSDMVECKFCTAKEPLKYRMVKRNRCVRV